ncbi:hypothetical protein BDN67DRAFT_990258 [Paxillus ammoniavirescens]|nr:hypothetical protein BDN67DRAFT_990258 [Paxillus ammoniavirescens]
MSLWDDPDVQTLRNALTDRVPFHSGICKVPDRQLMLYYSQDDIHRRIDFSKVGEEELEVLYRACKPATFGRNGEDVLDETYRKAGKMDLTAFSTLFDPRSLGIHDQIIQGLFTRDRGVQMELYKLNVYGKGDFFKPHQDTPRGEGMVGSLVVVLPTQHEGGQFVLRNGRKEWAIDFTDKFAAATEPSICFITFFGDVEHEVLPVTSGYRVTLTYNLYYDTPHATSFHFSSPAHQTLKEALVKLINDKTKLQNGGYFGFGLQHEYVYSGHKLLDSLLDQLKGQDQVLADVCEELDLRYSLRLLYQQNPFSFLTVGQLLGK